MSTQRLKIWFGFQLDDANRRLLFERLDGHDVIVPETPSDSLLAPAPADAVLADADIAFGQPDVVSTLATTRLRWLQLTTAGFTRYDTPEFRAFAASKGLAVANASSVYDDPCAEQVLAFMLAQARMLPAALADRSANDTASWRKLRSSCRLMRGETVLILGYGAIAKRIIELLRPFDMGIVALRRKPEGDEEVPVIGEEDLDPVLASADHVINALPASDATVAFLNRERLAGMKPGSVLYNIGRGNTVDQQALAEALHSGHLAAAWLDVTEPEPLPADHSLRSAPNCHITPHIGGGYDRETESLVLHFADNFDRFLRGEPLKNRIM